MATWAIVTFRTIGLRTRRFYSNLPGIGLRWITVSKRHPGSRGHDGRFGCACRWVVDGTDRVCPQPPCARREPALLDLRRDAQGSTRCSLCQYHSDSGHERSSRKTFSRRRGLIFLTRSSAISPCPPTTRGSSDSAINITNNPSLYTFLAPTFSKPTP